MRVSFDDYVVTALSYMAQPAKRKLIQLSHELKDKTGLEIGGPSSFFKLRSPFPVYVFARQIDGLNFSKETVWEGSLEEGKNYEFTKGKFGYQHISEACDLTGIEPEKYDFLLSCHSLEHVANPIKALINWNKVIKKGGKMALILPNKEFTFDIKRPYTTFGHLLEDFEKNTGEDDATHFEEIIELTEIEKDEFVKNREALKQRTFDNFNNRCVHHHVFSLPLIKQLLEHCGFRVIHQQKSTPFHLVTIAEKV